MNRKHGSGLACAVVGVGLLASCGQPQPGASGAHSADAPMPLNGVTARQLVATLSREGLPAANPHDVTTEMCPKVRCVEAVDTDSVSVLKFPATGLAQKYAGSLSNSFQVEDVVMVFTPTVTPEMKRDYENVVERSLA